MTDQLPGRALIPLAGLKVLELGDGVAGAVAADTLAALGAEVTTATDCESVLRALSPQFDGTSLLSAVLDSRKHVAGEMNPDRLPREIAAADLILCDRIHRGTPGLPEAPAAYLQFVAQHNRATWVTVSAFGMTGHRAACYGSDLTISAASGVLSIVTDPATSRPMKLPGVQALLSAGAAAALAGCHALSEHAATGVPQHADVSAQAAALMTGPVLQCTAPLLNTAGAGGSGRFGAPAGLYRCRDGAIYIMAMEQHQWNGLARALGNPPWAQAFESVDARLDRAEECNAHIAEAVRPWNRFELEQRLQQEGVPAGAVRGPLDLLASPQFASRGALRAVDVGGHTARIVNTPFQVTAGAHGSDSLSTSTIRGLHVLEAGHILAVPLAGALLGACGADVVKLEDPQRPDSYRTRGPYVDGHADQDWCAYFALMNHSKQSLEIDFSKPDIVAALLGAADVIIENYGPNRARRYRIDAAKAADDHPGLLAVSSSGYGHDGPWASYRAYAYNLHSSAGLQYLTRGPEGQPVHVEMALADLMTGYALATIVAAWAVGSNRSQGGWTDLAMAELVAARFNDLIAAADLGVETAGQLGSNHQAPYAPNGVYLASDGRWVAISVLTDEDWKAVKALLDNPESLQDTSWSTTAGRAASPDELDVALEAEVQRAAADPLVDGLSRSGVLAAVVHDPAQLLDDSALLNPVHLPQVDHPLWGQRRLLGLPWTFTGRRPIEITPPPPLGSARTATGSWAQQLMNIVDSIESGVRI